MLFGALVPADDGARRNVWPSEAVIRGLTRGLRERPLMEDPIVTSWLALIEGSKAELGGYLVELLRFLRRHPRPPMAMDRRKILEEAAENQRGRELMLGRDERGTATADDRAALAAYEEDLRPFRDIVAAGRAKRAAGKWRDGREAAGGDDGGHDAGGGEEYAPPPPH